MKIEKLTPRDAASGRGLMHDVEGQSGACVQCEEHTRRIAALQLRLAAVLAYVEDEDLSIDPALDKAERVEAIREIAKGDAHGVCEGGRR